VRPIISIVGKSDTGKTTLLEGLIAELKQRGYKITAIKHAGDDFELDKEGKDSWRLGQAGSEVVAISSPHKLAVVKQMEHDLSPQEISRFIKWDCDLILTEGFKKSNNPKVEVHSKEQGSELLSPPKQLLAVVTDEPLAIDVPQFSRNEIQKLADLTEKWLQKRQREDDIELLVNDVFVSLNPFIKKLMASVLLAIISNLKGIGKIKSLGISLRRKA